MKKMKFQTISLIISFIVSFILLFITSIIFAYTNINDAYLNMFVFGSIAIAVLIGSIFMASRIKEKGIIYGALMGVFYCLILYLVTALLYKGFFWTNTVAIYLGISAIMGALGGVIGVNLK